MNQRLPGSSLLTLPLSRRRFGALAEGMRILYGGSVKPDNAAAIFSVADVDGALVGGASLKAADFSAIITALEASDGA